MANNSWDPSVLGVTAEELSHMSEEERREFAIDALNRAADLLLNVVGVFGDEFPVMERAAIFTAAQDVIRVTRSKRE